MLVYLFTNCSRSSGELTVIPPATNPLTREFIGYGVVNVSFTHLLDEPGPSGSSLGYLRGGTVVRIIERRTLFIRGNTELWVLAENYQGTGNASQGWLLETNLEIYDNESRANTASRAMNL